MEDHVTPQGEELVLRDEGESTATTLTSTAAGGVLTPITVTKRRKERHRSIPLMPEVRHFRAEGLEIREQSKTNEIVISGSPIVYDTPYTVMDMFGEFQERMAPGVATDVLPTADVRFLFNHDGLPLARSASGTMILRDTPGALTFEAHLDARQQLSNDLAVAIERGDVSQMSCGFVVARDEWDEGMEDRTIHRFADLLDVSAVTYPASPTTSLQIAQRMAMAMPVESRARLRRAYVDLRDGKALSQNRLEAFRSLLSTDLDPGDDLVTPEGTGPLGHPEGEGATWANTTPPDGTQGAGTTDGGAPSLQDGTGSRSEEPATEQREDDADTQVSRATRLRLARATRRLK